MSMAGGSKSEVEWVERVLETMSVIDGKRHV
jgi:hypothetical protein